MGDFNPPLKNTSLLDVTLNLDSGGGESGVDSGTVDGPWYMTGAGLSTDPAVPEAESPDITGEEVKEVAVELTEIGLSLAASIAMLTGATPAQAKKQVAVQHQNDPSIVTIKEKMPVWAWIVIGLTGAGILGALGWLTFGKKK